MSLQAGSLFRVDGIVAVITGGGSGIGLIMARALAANGAKRVFILGRRESVLREAAAQANAEDDIKRDVLVPVVCDVGDKASLQAAVDAVAADPVAGGVVNLVIANAGVMGPPQFYDPKEPSIAALRKRLFDTPMEEVTAVFHANVTGALYTIFAFLELLDAGNQQALSGDPKAFGAPQPGQPASNPQIQSQVIVTASIAGFMKGHFTTPAYNGSKAAILQLTKQAAGMLAPYRIRANALAPGLFPSELATVLTGNRQPENETFDHPSFIPARKFGGENDMAGMILYLASAAGSFANGLVLAVDGGRMAVTASSY